MQNNEPAPPVLTWEFPLPRTHTGVLLGNGRQGLMVWGDAALHVTIGRAGFWDHRGGNAFAARTTYAEVRALLEAGDAAGLRRVFENPPAAPGQPARPTQVGGARLELHFQHGARPVRAELDTATASLRVHLSHPDGQASTLLIRQAMDAELAWVELDEARHGPVEVVAVPAWDAVGHELAQVGCAPPEQHADSSGGCICQRLPDDPALALAWARRGSALVIATALGDAPLEQACAAAQHADLAALGERADRWWQAYWRGLPRVRLPDAVLQHAWDYGVYKLAGLTTPGGVAATLQGPWIEEYQLPPWSCDYHFNINIQMIYWPCLLTGRFEHLWPLWEMLRSWLPQMQANGRAFFGADDALLMPHAVDDRCAAVGSFWTGMIDQGCAAWMAQLAWLHYTHSGDARVLSEIAWPLLSGAFNGYWAMLEQVERGGRRQLSLPVSVSPEYRGAAMDAWGRDASFQLAALHMLAGILPQAADAVGAPHDPRWARARAELPAYTLVGAPGEERIGLWEGQDLDESHRHHSHLAALYPFCTIDPLDQEHSAVVQRSLRHWVARGAGAWTGWCIPWAATLCARLQLPDAAVAWLHWWDNVFTNEGHGTLHDAAFDGCTVFSPQRSLWKPSAAGNREVMQIEAGMGAVSAIQELLVQCRGDLISVLPQVPRRWGALAFDGIWAPGGFRVGASVAGGQVEEVRVESTRGGPLTLAHGISGAWLLDGRASEEAVLRLDTLPGQTIVLRRR